jgi:hypothetical protein
MGFQAKGFIQNEISKEKGAKTIGSAPFRFI